MFRVFPKETSWTICLYMIDSLSEEFPLVCVYLCGWGLLTYLKATADKAKGKVRPLGLAGRKKCQQKTCKKVFITWYFFK